LPGPKPQKKRKIGERVLKEKKRFHLGLMLKKKNKSQPQAWGENVASSPRVLYSTETRGEDELEFLVREKVQFHRSENPGPKIKKKDRERAGSNAVKKP